MSDAFDILTIPVVKERHNVPTIMTLGTGARFFFQGELFECANRNPDTIGECAGCHFCSGQTHLDCTQHDGQTVPAIRCMTVIFRKVINV